MLTNILTNSLPLQGLHFSDLVAYLQLTGWKHSNASNERWLVFEGEQDAHGEPLEVVLPRNLQSPDMRVYLSNAVELLAALHDVSVEEIIGRIRLQDRDILRIKNLDSEEETSISLNVAYRQIREVRHLIAIGAFADRNPRPYFRSNEVKQSAYHVADMYRFGHTFAGSFGLTIECPITNPVQFYQHRLSLDEGGEPETVRPVIPPIERRVMERIVRGLVLAEHAGHGQDVERLLNQYIDAFNANMCTSVRTLLPEEPSSVAFTIDWSPKIEPPSDIQRPGSIRLNSLSDTYLGYAAERMRELQPERVRIEGLVESLTSRANPRSRHFGERMIIVRWLNRPAGRPVEVVMRLEPDDYLKAIEAHRDWRRIEVSGELSRTNNPLRLANPQDFRIIGG